VKTLLLAALLPWMASAEIFIKLEAGIFRVTGLASTPEPAQGWPSLVSVFAGSGDVPSMNGVYSFAGGVLLFQPRYPLVSGVQYRAVYHPKNLEPTVFLLDGPAPVIGPLARLEKMYPSTGVLPSNQLKLYLEFSQPMSRGGIWSRIHLIRDDGKAVELPFLEIDQELWTPDQRRLTVLFDPGRIKRGVTPQQELGEVLEPGRSYTLVVDREMADARNQPLADSFRREFRVAPALREGIDVKKWKLTASRELLTVEFDRPLDWALLQHVLRVNGVAGASVIDREETRWRFTPTQPLKPGHYELVVDMALEDLAGNRIGRPFDVDLFERVTERITAETTTLGFDIK
jgi:hypothetical protein